MHVAGRHTEDLFIDLTEVALKTEALESVASEYS